MSLYRRHPTEKIKTTVLEPLALTRLVDFLSARGTTRGVDFLNARGTTIQRKKRRDALPDKWLFDSSSYNITLTRVTQRASP